MLGWLRSRERSREKIRESSDPYYDPFDEGDFDLIIASFQMQYGMRLSDALLNMKWPEFAALISGLGPNTPLGQIVAIRSENDQERLKTFSPAQHRIRNEYRNRMAKKVSQEEIDNALEFFKNAFIDMAGGGPKSKK